MISEFGYVLWIGPLLFDETRKLSFRKLYYACEIGYNHSANTETRCYVDNPHHNLNDISNGDSIRVFGVPSHAKDKFVLTSIDKYSFSECVFCLYPQEEDYSCVGCVNEVTPKLTGIWTFVELKIKSDIDVMFCIFENETERIHAALHRSVWRNIFGGLLTFDVGQRYNLRGWFPNLTPNDADNDDEIEYHYQNNAVRVSRSKVGKAVYLIKMKPVNILVNIER